VTYLLYGSVQEANLNPGVVICVQIRPIVLQSYKILLLLRYCNSNWNCGL